MTHFRVSKINLDDGNVVFFFTTMNIETMAGYVSYFIFQSETPIYPTALFQKHRLKSHYEGFNPPRGVSNGVFEIEPLGV